MGGRRTAAPVSHAPMVSFGVIGRDLAANLRRASELPPLANGSAHGALWDEWLERTHDHFITLMYIYR